MEPEERANEEVAAGQSIADWQAQRQAMRMATAKAQPQKNPGAAAVLSFLFSGLGQLYNGQMAKAGMFFGLAVLNFLLVFVVIGIFTGIICWVWGIIDAYKAAEKINTLAAGSRQPA
jgi:TM2 domain-containing membrane protein YozV